MGIRKYALAAIGASWLAFALASPATAGLCTSATNCSLIFNQANSSSALGSGNFGTLQLNLTGTTVSVSVTAAAGYGMKLTGFPGIVGFVDSLGGGLAYSNLVMGTYTGTLSNVTNNLGFDGFGSANNAVGTVGPKGPNPVLTSMSFDVTKAGLTDVNFLVNLFNPAGGDGQAFFVFDVIVTDATLTANPNDANGTTGLVAVQNGCANGNIGACGTSVPEPSSLVLLLSILSLMGFGYLGMSRRARA